MLIAYEKSEYGEKGRWTHIHIYENYRGTRIILDYILTKWKIFIILTNNTIPIVIEKEMLILITIHI